MPAPILATKLYIPPPRPHAVHRSRLIERLNEGLQRTPGVTLISAPAGFGKTTLVSEWISTLTPSPLPAASRPAASRTREGKGKMWEGNMVDLPQKKVGIVACSGEELAEGTVTRLVALKVLEQLRPKDTVTICLPLFLAGGEGDRAFARFYPTIALDGCDKRCAAKATELYSGKPAASVL
ncbi:MAG TPA: putative zinc-binding protein, partial [Anaerolineae bacterium]|nr:putative zinc-binding protein [Anaerolineae bacterium]